MPQLEWHLLLQVKQEQCILLVSSIHRAISRAGTCSRKGYSELCKNRISSFIKENVSFSEISKAISYGEWKNPSHDSTLIAKPPCSCITTFTNEVTPMVPVPLYMHYSSTKKLRHQLSQSWMAFCLALLTKRNLNLYATFPGSSITPHCTPAPFHYNHTLPIQEAAKRVCPPGIILKHWQRA